MALKVTKKKGKNVLSGALPKGNLSWVTISGEGKENYNKDGMIYQASVDYPDKVGQPIVDQIQEYYDSFTTDKSQQGGMGHRIGVLVDNGSDEAELKFIAPGDVTKKHTLAGRIQFSFKTNTEYEGKKIKIPVYNAKAKKVELPEDVSIGNGSTGSIQGSVVFGESARKHFLSFYLNGVQVTKLVEYTGANDFEEDDEAEGWEGYEDEDTGFIAGDGSEEEVEV